MTMPYWDPVAGLERSRRLGAGHVLFQHAWLGDNNNSGISPDEPLETLTAALDLCGDDIQDYIISMSSWTQEPSFPVTIPVAHRAVHFIGTGRENDMLGSYLYPGVTDEPSFFIDSGAVNIEIAGFNLGGGVTHGCIEVGSAQKAWIHHNWFGNQDQLAGNLPGYGIEVPTGASGFMVCEDNVFLGDQLGVQGGISINGVDVAAGAWMTIRRNRFMGCVIGIRLFQCAAGMIYNNLFVCPDVQGAAITLRAHANCLGNMVTGNVAMEGAETAMATNPFEDLNNNDLNHFGDNRCTLAAGIAMAHVPA